MHLPAISSASSPYIRSLKTAGIQRQNSDISTIQFRGDAAPSVQTEEKAALENHARLRVRDEQFLSKVVYNSDGEYITGLDVLKAVKKAGYKVLLNPFISLNPIKWGQMVIAAAVGDGYSQWVSLRAIRNNLSLNHTRRGNSEAYALEQALKHCLEEAFELQLLTYDSGIMPPHIVPVWRPMKDMHTLLSGKKSTATREAMEKDIDSRKLKSNFEEQIQQLEFRRNKLKDESGAHMSRYQNEERQLQSLANEEAQLQERLIRLEFSTDPHSETQKDGLRDQLKLLATRIDNKQELVAALKLQVEVATALSKKLKDDTGIAIATIEKTLNRLEITRINAETLKMSGQLKEKAQADLKLAEQLEEANLAYFTIKSALDAENPQVFIEMIRQLETKVDVTTAENPLKDLASKTKARKQSQ